MTTARPEQLISVHYIPSVEEQPAWDLPPRVFWPLFILLTALALGIFLYSCGTLIWIYWQIVTVGFF